MNKISRIQDPWFKFPLFFFHTDPLSLATVAMTTGQELKWAGRIRCRWGRHKGRQGQNDGRDSERALIRASFENPHAKGQYVGKRGLFKLFIHLHRTRESSYRWFQTYFHDYIFNDPEKPLIDMKEGSNDSTNHYSWIGTIKVPYTWSPCYSHETGINCAAFQCKIRFRMNNGPFDA